MANDYSRSANEIAADYNRNASTLSSYAPRTGTLSIWMDGGLERDADYESDDVTVEVNGTTIIARAENGNVEVFYLKPGSYASFMYDDEG